MMNQKFRVLALGLLPVVLFGVIEEYFGTLWGLVAGMIFGVGEILWEYQAERKVSMMTWGGNGMLLVLGGVSLATDSGIWFKLQPAVLEAAFAAILWGSWWMKKPMLLLLIQKQGGLPVDLDQKLRPGAAEVVRAGFFGMTLRMGFFFAAHAGLAVWAALKWSTAAWVMLKGVGLTVSLLVYMVAESLLMRAHLKRGAQDELRSQ